MNFKGKLMSTKNEKFSVKHSFVIDFMFDEKFRAHRIILGIILILVSLILPYFLIKIVFWFFGLMFIASGIIKSCPIREHIKDRIISK